MQFVKYIMHVVSALFQRFPVSYVQNRKARFLPVFIYRPRRQLPITALKWEFTNKPCHKNKKELIISPVFVVIAENTRNRIGLGYSLFGDYFTARLII